MLPAGQPHRCRRKEVSVEDAVRLKIYKSNREQVAGSLRGALESYGKREDGKWTTVLVVSVP
jgi:hypothetical protein